MKHQQRVTKPYHIGWRPRSHASKPWRWRNRRPRRPWQSEAGTGVRFARRGFTAAGAERAMLRDLAHFERTGEPSPHQRWLVWRVSISDAIYDTSRNVRALLAGRDG